MEFETPMNSTHNKATSTSRTQTTSNKSLFFSLIYGLLDIESEKYVVVLVSILRQITVTDTSLCQKILRTTWTLTSVKCNDFIEDAMCKPLLLRNFEQTDATRPTLLLCEALNVT